MDIISRNFELRYVSNDHNADGETDFKGETSTLSTDQRVEYLNAYSKRLPEFVSDFSLDDQIVTLEEAQERLLTLKPQPQPQVRNRICLDEWKWIGYDENAGVKQNISAIGETRIKPQNWRCFLQWEITENAAYENCEFSFGTAAVVGFDSQKRPYYFSGGEKRLLADVVEVRQLEMELDFVYKKWNLYLNGRLYADFVDFTDTATEEVTSFCAKIPECQNIVSKIWGVGYHRKDDVFEPYTIATFVDEDFKDTVCMNGWNKLGYNDSDWECAALPIVHGGERYAGQDLYLRKEIEIEEVSPVAELYLESLTPGGEVYINGRLAAFIQDECCHKIDVSQYLLSGKNLLAVRVYADKVAEAEKMTHTHTDRYTGWFAARMHLDLLPEVYIEDVFAWTDSIGENSAVQKIQVGVKAKRGMASKAATNHDICVRMIPWYPEDGDVVASTQWQTHTVPNLVETTTSELTIADPVLWQPGKSALYKLEVTLKDLSGNVVDDFIVTTGIRTVSQDGGIFRINGKPELLRAPLLFGARPPMDKIAAWEKCPPAEFYVQEMLMTQKMNGNGLRMSVHDERIGGISDPRICEIADQLGIMLGWQTTTWLRITCASNINWEELATCIKQVRNHCSIVMWQPTNHPSWKNWDVAMEIYHLMYDTITAVDTSRLISPSADFRRMYARFDDGMTDFWGNPCESCDPVWTAKGICRGNMDYILGYGNEWSALRQWPNVEDKNLPLYMESTAYIPSFLHSPDRAYFNFEHDEIIGQPNWNIHKGKPTYHLDSYERHYDEGSIGRVLSHDEWLASQAWQALGAYETICKCRWLDYDGLSWCNLRGGQNTGTYQKALVDYYGQPKLAFYAHQMAFQDVLACSHNVDMVYGPDDSVPVIVMNIGTEQKVTILVDVISESGKLVYQQKFENVDMAAGRSVNAVAEMKLPELENGLYTFRYTVCR